MTKFGQYIPDRNFCVIKIHLKLTAKACHVVHYGCQHDNAARSHLKDRAHTRTLRKLRP